MGTVVGVLLKGDQTLYNQLEAGSENTLPWSLSPDAADLGCKWGRTVYWHLKVLLGTAVVLHSTARWALL